MSHPNGNNTSCNFLLADNLINPGLMEIRDTRPGRNVALFPFFFFFNYTRARFSVPPLRGRATKYIFVGKVLEAIIEMNIWKIFPRLMKFNDLLM